MLSDGFPQAIVRVAIEIEAVADVDAGARAKPSDGRQLKEGLVAGRKDFTVLFLENHCPGLPPSPADIGHCIELIVETEGRFLSTAHPAWQRSPRHTAWASTRSRCRIPWSGPPSSLWLGNTASHAGRRRG